MGQSFVRRSSNLPSSLATITQSPVSRFGPAQRFNILAASSSIERGNSTNEEHLVFPEMLPPSIELGQPTRPVLLDQQHQGSQQGIIPAVQHGFALTPILFLEVGDGHPVHAIVIDQNSIILFIIHTVAFPILLMIVHIVAFLILLIIHTVVAFLVIPIVNGVIIRPKRTSHIAIVLVLLRIGSIRSNTQTNSAAHVFVSVAAVVRVRDHVHGTRGWHWHSRERSGSSGAHGWRRELLDGRWCRADGRALLGGSRRASEHGQGSSRDLGGGVQDDDAEAEGEVGVDGGVLDLVQREAGRVPCAHGHVPGLADPGVPEESARHVLDGGVPHACDGAQLGPAGDAEAVVRPEHAGVVGGSGAGEGDPGVGEEAAQRLGDGVGVDDVEDEAAVAHAELERAGQGERAVEREAGGGEVGVHGSVLNLVLREAGRVPGARGHFLGLVDAGVAEEAMGHVLDGRVPRAGDGAQLHPVAHVEAAVRREHAGVVSGAGADEGDPGVGEEAAQPLRDGVGAGEVVDQAPVADAELERVGDRGLAVEGLVGRGPLHAEAHHEASPAEEPAVAPARGGNPAARVGWAHGGEGGEAVVEDADGVGVVGGRRAAEAGGDGGVVHGGGDGGGGGGWGFFDERPGGGGK
ncbi:hypothetical protein U9M48_011354, partial [Paspalum notatum var. saurae]